MMKACLAIDIGNTRTKFAVFEGRDILHSSSLKNEALELNNEILKNYEIEAMIVSSVNEKAEETLQLGTLNIPTLILNHKTALPFQLE